jgi:histidinol dehydrogenase
MLRVIRGRDFEIQKARGLDTELIDGVRRIISDVRERGDEAIKEYTRRFDGVELDKLRVEKNCIEEARERVDNNLKDAITLAIENLTIFCRRQMEVFKSLDGLSVEIRRGVIARQRVLPIERVGVYVPGGRYPLVSSLIMAAVPAIVAGVKEIVVCSPPNREKKIDPLILYAASVLNIEEIYTIGGAQAVAGLAIGTQTIKQVDKLVGPGNIYVTLAKKELFGEVGIDFIAGPTEVLIIADGSANPEYIAADMLAQAEHDIMARPILITDNPKLVEDVQSEVKRQLESLETSDVATRSIKEQGLIIVVDSVEEAIEIANHIAPEHLELHIKETEAAAKRLKNFGTLFVGEFSIEALGDYSSGINHILPTNRAARYTGGLSVRDFLKFNTTLQVLRDGIREIGESAITLAEAEGLKGHSRSIKIRLRKM